MTELSFRAVPGPAFIAGSSVSTWVQADAAASIAYVLIGHAPPQRPEETAETIKDGLLGMVEAMNLHPAAPAAEWGPYIGARLIPRGPYVALDYGHPKYLMRLSPDAEWFTLLAAGELVRVVIGLDPIPPGAGPEGIERWLVRVVATGRAHVGTTSIRSR